VFVGIVRPVEQFYQASFEVVVFPRPYTRRRGVLPGVNAAAALPVCPINNTGTEGGRRRRLLVSCLKILLGSWIGEDQSSLLVGLLVLQARGGVIGL